MKKDTKVCPRNNIYTCRSLDYIFNAPLDFTKLRYFKHTLKNLLLNN